ncbi:MAG: gamma-aminobutyrate permease, partial [Bacillota bacterium]|nr:gamma-aminobutyrate permease [Bacillota bacterium]
MPTTTDRKQSIVSTTETTELKRGLKARHLTMISLGGHIGTGLFLASGGAIHT